MTWKRSALQLLLTVALTVVAERTAMHTLQGAGDQWLGMNDTLKMYHGGNWDGEYVEGDAVTEVGDADATDPGYFETYEDEPAEQVIDRAEASARAQPGPPGPSWSPVDNPSSRELNLECGDTAFTFSLHASPITELKVVGADTVLVNADKKCRYSVSPYENTVTVPYTGCGVDATPGQNTLRVSYISAQGRLETANLTCAEGLAADELNPRASDGGQSTPNCASPAGCANPPSNGNSPRGTAQNCGVASGEQVVCGSPSISTVDCELRGCCVDAGTSRCYYPMDECTVDKHFVFAIRPNSASIVIDTTRLIIPNQPSCVPTILNPAVAVYKFPLTDCGSRSYEVGNTMIYMVEVHTIVQAYKLKYGAIARSDAIRFMIECRYPKSGTDGQALTSVGYQVKIPTLSFPSTIITQGQYGVELRLATDRTFASYYPTAALPLRVLLGAPVYLELNLVAVRPSKAELVVNYCLAFPRNARNALVLIYEGCSNPNDQTTSVLSVRGDPTNKHQRRFMTQAFQFMDVQTNTYLDEQIFFMCSTTVCIEPPCAQGCFTGAPA